ncbi:putative serine dehydratase domain-containing protein [Lyophyllum atratum]|nr:putative serine dehydratase domain-containing protein [Lyophyllum atratum]
MATQTKTPYSLLERPRKAILVEEFLNEPLDALRTPAIIIDRTVFAENCADMHARSKAWGASFRAHLKTHKTVEGTRLQLQSSVDKTQSVVVSTLMEAWAVVKAGLVADSTVKDILYGLPVAVNKVADLSELWDEVSKDGGTVRLLVDHPDQVKFLEKFEKHRESPRRWSVFVKVDGGQRRAGLSIGSPLFKELLSALFSSSAVSVYGFYGHAGNSYASTSSSEASSFLSGEVDAVNSAAEAGLAALSVSLSKESHQQPFVLSVGATPTAHAASAETRELLSSSLHGILELHAGNYPMLDLQQQHTGMIDGGRIAQRVLATVVSYYPGRGENGEDEALIDAGAIAFSKDTGPSGGYGEVVGKGWRVGRIAQEHGILTKIRGGNASEENLELGSLVEIVGQHACLIAAAYPWYYIVDKNVEQGKKVVDVWVPWKGW